MMALHASGGEIGPVTFPAFKAGDPSLREPDGGFDSHTPPPSPRTALGFGQKLHVESASATCGKAIRSLRTMAIPISESWRLRYFVEYGEP